MFNNSTLYRISPIISVINVNDVVPRIIGIPNHYLDYS